MNYLNGSILTEEQQSILFQLYNSGFSQSEIAKMLGVSVAPVRNVMKINGGLRSHEASMRIASERGVFKASAKKKENSHLWKGGRSIDNGYVSVHNPFYDPNVAGQGIVDKSYYIREHRLVWILANGNIPDGFEVHHINGIKTDNRIENLVILSKSDHAKRHTGNYDSEHNAQCASRSAELISILRAKIVELEKTNAELSKRIEVMTHEHRD